MKKITSIVIMFFAILSTQANAEKLKGGYPACISEDLFDQLGIAAAKDDTQTWNYLFENGCFMTRGGISVTVLDSSRWKGKVKIKAYFDGESIVLWTNTENVIR